MHVVSQRAMKLNFSCSPPSARYTMHDQIVSARRKLSSPSSKSLNVAKKKKTKTRRRDEQAYTYKIILNFLKLDPQLLELCRQELREVEAAGVGRRAPGRQGAGSQEQQDQG